MVHIGFTTQSLSKMMHSKIMQIECGGLSSLKLTLIKRRRRQKKLLCSQMWKRWRNLMDLSAALSKQPNYLLTMALLGELPVMRRLTWDLWDEVKRLQGLIIGILKWMTRTWSRRNKSWGWSWTDKSRPFQPKTNTSVVYAWARKSQITLYLVLATVLAQWSTFTWVV